MKSSKFLKKAIFVYFLLLFFSLSIFVLITKKDFQEQQTLSYEIVDRIFSNIKTKYPKISEEELLESLNSENSNFLETYGIYKGDVLFLEQQVAFKKQQQKNGIIFVTLFTCFSFIFILFEFKKEKEIRKINQAITKISQGEEVLDLKGNKEDELSYLKNELYKITVMLKQGEQIALEDKKKMKEYLENISHQIKTPLTAITIMLDTILEDPTMKEEVKQEFLEDIQAQIEHIYTLIFTLLKLSQLEVNVIPFKQENISLLALIKDVKTSLEPLAQEKNIQIDIKKVTPITIQKDYFQEKEALLNIVKNAIEHSKKNGAIQIKTAKNHLFIEISIQDEGEGMNEEEVRKIFQRFYSNTNNPNSIGIGLNLARTIIEKDGGIIEVKSKKNEGTEFIIRFPS